MATRIAVMSGGRVVQVGTPREIYYRPVDRFVADFIGESNFLAGAIRHGGGDVLRARWRGTDARPDRPSRDRRP